ncbi:DUF4386 domain-containing protein [Tateyamaria pelophila]|uniref:DUF4386 domain-containing protein n=1 Tax=Tateyamaria pelophila TaxID=328415 RepID=UPI001CBB8123|nr:DUF4386 domain-containing protein [Tateyamaria pelophila]
MSTESGNAAFAVKAPIGNEITRRSARIAAALFVVATASTMASQIIVEQLHVGETSLAAQQGVLTFAVVFEIANGLASAGIALALYPVLRHLSELMATGYLGLRLVEGALGVAAAASLMLIAAPEPATSAWASAHHDALFLLVLIVFSCGTFCFYPLLFKFRLVPRLLSFWGMIGGLTLLISCILILFGRIEAGGTTDLVLSLPIWVNEMVLAAWLYLRGLDLSNAV